VCIIN